MDTFDTVDTIDTIGAERADHTAAGPIVVGLDRSGTAAAAAARAAELARDAGATLHLVMAVDAAVSYEIVVGSDLFRVDNITEGHDYLRDAGGKFTGLTVTSEVSDEAPATALVEAAERLGARMIVVGNRRVQGAGRVLGSVATEVLRRAPCDVVVAHTTGRT